jgi:hypothetical protein
VQQGPAARGGQVGKEGWLIEKDGGSGRCSSMKADGGMVRAKSRAGRSPPVTDGGQEVEGVLGELVQPGKRREKGGKGGGRGGDGGCFKPARGGGGRLVGWRHAAGES